ncbi:MAG: acetylglutamate kinase [Clostridia bacterium]|nr:acetylglutamate kinase [Clostridia bacterium]
MEISNAQRAVILTQALPYIQKYYGKIVVVKYGGNAMINDSLKEQVMEDIVLLSLIGVKVVLVHGGGPEITDMLKRVGKESVFCDGLRVTDRETAEIVQMVLAGKINKSLVNMLEIKGGRAIGLSGMDGHMLRAEMKDERLGFVGRITEVDVTPISDLLERGYIPVVSTVGCDTEGNIYNINADTAAARIAGALSAERLFTMTDIEGILRDRSDPASIISKIDIAGARALFESGVISGGMIPKVECCIEAIERGVKSVIILDGRVPHELLIEMLTDEGAGTMIVRDENDE